MLSKEREEVTEGGGRVVPDVKGEVLGKTSGNRQSPTRRRLPLPAVAGVTRNWALGQWQGGSLGLVAFKLGAEWA